MVVKDDVYYSQFIVNCKTDQTSSLLHKWLSSFFLRIVAMIFSIPINVALCGGVFSIDSAID